MELPHVHKQSGIFAHMIDLDVLNLPYYGESLWYAHFAGARPDRLRGALLVCDGASDEPRGAEDGGKPAAVHKQFHLAADGALPDILLFAGQSPPSCPGQEAIYWVNATDFRTPASNHRHEVTPTADTTLHEPSAPRNANGLAPTLPLGPQGTAAVAAAATAPLPCPPGANPLDNRGATEEPDSTSAVPVPARQASLADSEPNGEPAHGHSGPRSRAVAARLRRYTPIAPRPASVRLQSPALRRHIMMQHNQAVMAEEHDLLAEGASFTNASDPSLFCEQPRPPAAERYDPAAQPAVLGAAKLAEPEHGGSRDGTGRPEHAGAMNVPDDAVNWLELVQSLEEDDGGRATVSPKSSSLKSTASLEESFRSAF